MKTSGQRSFFTLWSVSMLYNFYSIQPYYDFLCIWAVIRNDLDFTYHERLSIVRKIINESKASIVGVLLLRPPARPRQPPAL